MATNSRSFSPRSSAARRMQRPMRPKPLIAIRAMAAPPPKGLKKGGLTYFPDGWGVNGNHGALRLKKTGTAPSSLDAAVASGDRCRRLGAAASRGSERGAPAFPRVLVEQLRAGRRVGGRVVLALEVLGDEIDELGGEAQDLVGRVAVSTQLLEQGLGEESSFP